MVGDRLLRAADPAADWRVDPQSTQAELMLAGILAAPRDDPADRSGLAPQGQRGTTRRVWRIAFGGAAAMAATLAMSMVWSGGPNGAAAAYALSARPDGSVELTVRWEQLRGDVGRLATELRAAGVPTEVTSGTPTSFCAAPADRDRNGEALSKRAPNSQPASLDGYVMRPSLFPEGSVLVISTFSDRATQVTYTMLYLAPPGRTSCALNSPLGSARYTGPGPAPTAITWPAEPAE